MTGTARRRRPRLRALVLTAGFGTRLEPLTTFIPKPLVPVCGEAMAGHTLRRLRAIGCEVAAMNLHHLAEAIPQHFGRAFYGLPLRYFREEEVQGTLGALWAPRRLLGDCDAFLILNGDTLCDWPLARLVRRHVRSGAAATLLVHRREPAKELGGGVALDRDRRVVAIRDSAPIGEVASRHVFAGAHVLSPRLLERVEHRPGDIVTELYQPLLAEGAQVQAVVTDSPWFDLGTPERYLESTLAWARIDGPRWPRRHEVISPLAAVSPSATVRRAVIEEEAILEDDVTVEGSIVLGGARVGRGSRIRGSIVGPRVSLQAQTELEGRMVNRLPAGYQPSDGDTVMGDLVYTPM